MKYNDGLQLLYFNKNKQCWYKKNKKDRHKYILKESCKNCNNKFFSLINKKGLYCSNECSNKNRITSDKTKEILRKKSLGRKHTDKTKEKISLIKKGKKLSKEHKKNLSISHKGKILSEEHIQKISLSNKGRKLTEEQKIKLRCKYSSNNIPKYKLYFKQLFADICRRNLYDPNILEVKCTYCGKFFIPKLYDVKNRIQTINGKFSGEYRLYCSESCKDECPIYNQKLYPKSYKKSTSREVQPELRQLVLKRDKYKCIKCESTESLHCHHVEGIRWNPIESADIDKCITVCKSCHIEIHKKDQCKYTDLQCKKDKRIKIK